MTTPSTTKSLGIVDLLALRGFDQTRPAKLVRHGGEFDMDELVRTKACFDYYQATQGRPVFDGCERIVSFIATGGACARFVGVYRVKGRSNDCRPRPAPHGFPSQYVNGSPSRYVEYNHYFYDLEKEAGYEDLEDRVVIDWGKGTRTWVQKLSNKEVMEILPRGRLLPPFRDYLEFTLTHDQLKELYAHVEAHRDWREHLSAVAGVYLILANTTGQLYLGSAYGVEGSWGRWAKYAHDGHAGNKRLRELIQTDPASPTAFCYSILQILPKSYAKDVIVDHEQRYKKKLGSRATGLNAN